MADEKIMKELTEKIREVSEICRKAGIPNFITVEIEAGKYVTEALTAEELGLKLAEDKIPELTTIAAEMKTVLSEGELDLRT